MNSKLSESMSSKCIVESFELSARAFALGEYLENNSYAILNYLWSEVMIFRVALLGFSGCGGGGGGCTSTFFLAPINNIATNLNHSISLILQSLQTNKIS